MSPASILLVEDDSNLRRLYMMALKSDRFNVSVCCNGVEALDWLKQNTPKLIISDIMMPRMSGYELAEATRSLRPDLKDVPIIFLTAFDTDETKTKAIRCGGETTRVYTKPITLGELNRAVLELIK